jgi:C4-dicarboxylate transporter DctM subunit
MLVAISVFGTMVLLMILNIPIGFALGTATLSGLLVVKDLPLMVLAQRLYCGLDSFTLVAVPLFILTGQLMAIGGVTRDLMNLSMVFVGHLRGGLAYVNIVSSMIFAGITGSAATDTSSIGSILVPTMLKKGYEKDVTVAVTATSSTIGIMIPPSIPMVLYGVASNTSIGKLFAGGVVPGLMVGLGLMAVTGILARKRNYPREDMKPLKENLKICLRSIPALTTVVIILGGIITGFFTPTEAAGISVVYTFLLGMFYYKELKLKDMPGIIMEVGITMGMVALMISAASALGWLLTNQGIPKAIGDLILSTTNNKLIILALINLLLLFVGTWMDLTPAMIIFTPILLPIAVKIGIDPVHFGIIMVVNLAIGLFTPPVGLCLFLACGIAETSITDVLKAFIPFFIVMIAILVLITYIPQLSMFLPNLIMK